MQPGSAWASKGKGVPGDALRELVSGQYHIDSPGRDTDGLLTKVTDAVRDGPPDLSGP